MIGLANFTPIAGMGHLISEPKFKIPTPPPPPPPPPLLISDKFLRTFFSSTAGQGFQNTQWPAVPYSQ